MSNLPTLVATDDTHQWIPGRSGTIIGPCSPPPALPSTLLDDPDPERFRLRPGSLVPGTRLCVEGWLGEGTTAVVYRGVHVDLGRPLAIKVLREAEPSPVMRERFLDEARLTSELDSEFVVDVIDFGRLDDGRPYYAMGFLDGRPLDEILGEQPLDVERALTLLRMACKGLAVAHDRGIVHRDVKPANLMVVPRRYHERLVVLDFGIATSMGQVPVEVRGTPHTMAPEQIGGGVVDARTDVYALGCCAFHMLTGAPAMRGETVAAVLSAHLDEERPRIDPMYGVPKPIADVVHRCLELDPDGRYASVRELEAALCEAQIAAGLGGTGEHLEPPDVEEPRRTRIAEALTRSHRRVRARSVVLGGLAAALVLLVVALLVRSRLIAADADRVVVEQVAAAARDAAASSRFVYPSPRQQQATAYQHLVALERWDGPARGFAEQQAIALRTELGQLLLALGDQRWERLGEQGYARDYYAQALIFDHGLARARVRVGMTLGELAELRHKANTDSFSQTELETAAVLVPDAEAEHARARAQERAHTEQRAQARARAEQAKAQADTKQKESLVSPFPDPASRDPGQARRLVRSGNRAKRRGDLHQARVFYRSATELDDRNADAYGGLAELCSDEGRHDCALQYSKMAVRRAPSTLRHRLRLAESYQQLARRDEAIAEYRRAAEQGSRKARRRLDELGHG